MRQRLFAVILKTYVNIGYGTVVTSYVPGDLVWLPRAEAEAWCSSGRARRAGHRKEAAA